MRLLSNNMEDIQKAVEILNGGGVVIFPTDTAFGIGCRIDDNKAIERLFALRKRPLNQPPPVLISSLTMGKKYGDFSEEVIEKLVAPYWPGALTIIVPARKGVAPLMQKNGGIGLRIPNCGITQEIIEELGCALLGPSANFHGLPTPYRLEDLDPELVSLVDFVVPGEVSESEASTVINTTVTPWEIIRKGAIDIRI